MMREAEVPVTFLPADRTVYVLAGTRLIEAAAEAGIILDSPCGGEGICGKCRVRLEKGNSPLFTDAEIGTVPVGSLRRQNERHRR